MIEKNTSLQRHPNILRQTKKNIKKVKKKIKEKCINGKIQKKVVPKWKRKPELFFETRKQLKHNEKCNITNIKNKDENITTNKDKITDTWQQHFQ